MVKIATTCVKVDPTIRELFEEARPLHNKTLSDALQIGMLKVLDESLPATSLKILIEETKQLLSDQEASYTIAQKVEAERKKLVDVQTPISSTPILDSIFLDYRESLLNPESKGSIIGMMNRGTDPSWDRFYFKAGFQTASEAKKWCWAEAMKRGLVK